MIVAKERRQREVSAVGVFQIESRCRNEAAGKRALAGKGARFGKPPAFGAQASGKLVFDSLLGLLGLIGSGMCVGGKNGGHEPDSAQESVAKSGTGSHHRARLSPVCVKSLSSRSVWN